MPAQYTVTSVTGAAAVNYFDVGLYYQDDYKWRQNFTLSYGLRYESQNNIGDHTDWAPRFSFAWAPGDKGAKQAKTVIRGGYGWFFDRFAEDNILKTIRQNGINQQQYVSSTHFYQDAPRPLHFAASSTAPSSIYTIAPNLKASLNMQAAMGIDHHRRVATLSATFINSRGVHQD